MGGLHQCPEATLQHCCLSGTVSQVHVPMLHWADWDSLVFIFIILVLVIVLISFPLGSTTCSSTHVGASRSPQISIQFSASLARLGEPC